ncbi:MAG: transporter [Sandaracinaceae bacterium]|nr:transporter [Sandaracinaceae bacterium]
MSLLREPLLALFIVAAAGYLIGKIKIGGVSLGVAAVLFAGLALSALEPAIVVPDLIPKLGLALFIYSIGLSSGPGFFRLFRARGLRDGGLALGVLIAAAAISIGLGRLFGVSPELTAGLYCGSLTNTPALAAVVEGLSGEAASAPVVAYSVAYPFGVLGVLAAIVIVQRSLRLTYAVDRPSRLDPAAVGQALVSATVRVTSPEVTGKPLDELASAHGLHVRFSRLLHEGALKVADENAGVAQGDKLTVVGTHDHVQRAVALLGEQVGDRLDLDRSVLDYRRVFVSNPDLVEKPLESLRLFERYGATLTRIRRGDVELLAEDETELELGDRVRVVAPRERMSEISKLLGDSYQALAEIDALAFGLGIVLGLLLGAVPIPLPGGASFELGVAGGPLIAGLVLGRLGRTGPIVWTLPFSASVTLRQWGLLLFLGGVGLRSGSAFAQTVASPEGLRLLGAGAVVTFATSLGTLLIGHFILRIPFSVLCATVAGVHTQPAVLAFAHEQARSDLPRLGYTAVFPIASVAKIVLAQLILLLMRSS